MSEKVLCKNCGHEIRKNYFTNEWGHWESKMQEIEKECSYRIKHREYCDCNKPEKEAGKK